MRFGRFIGLKYKDRGRDWSGVDCYGLVELFYKEELGVAVPSYDYSTADNRTEVAREMERGMGEWVRIEEPEPGDVIVFRIFGLPIHTGIYAGEGDFLHTFRRTETCFERLDSLTWADRIHGIFRWQTT